MKHSQILQKQANLAAWNLKVREIIASSQYAREHAVAKYHLSLADNYLASALNAVSAELAERHFSLCEQSLVAAEKAASEEKFAQQKLVDDFYKNRGDSGGGIRI